MGAAVVQIALYAGLGFLLALLLVLIVSPLLHRRTIRLTERRMRAELPQSIEEIRADRDSIRADYAMRVRQLEIKLDKLNDAAVERSLLLEARNEEIATQKTEIRQKLEIIAEFSDDLDEQRNVTREREEELARAKAKIRELAARLDRKAKELERSEARFRDMETTVEKQRSELIETRASLRTAEAAAAGPARTPITSELAGADQSALFADQGGERSGGQRSGDDEIRIDPPMTSEPRIDAMFEEKPAGDDQSAEIRIQITELEAAKFAAELRAKQSEDQLTSVEGKVAELEDQLTKLREAGGSGAVPMDDDQRQARIFDLEAQMGGLEADIATKDSRISALMEEVDLARSGSNDDEATAALRTRLLDVETEKAAFEAEVTRLTLDLEMANSKGIGSAAGPAPDQEGLTEQLRDMEHRLEEAQSDRDRALAQSEELSRELKNRDSLSESQRKIEQAEITLLRESLSDLAAEVTNIVMTLEGEDSPVNGILSASNGHANADDFSGSQSGAIISLADRIKTLRERAASTRQ